MQAPSPPGSPRDLLLCHWIWGTGVPSVDTAQPRSPCFLLGFTALFSPDSRDSDVNCSLASNPACSLSVLPPQPPGGFPSFGSASEPGHLSAPPLPMPRLPRGLQASQGPVHVHGHQELLHLCPAPGCANLLQCPAVSLQCKELPCQEVAQWRKLHTAPGLPLWSANRLRNL